MVFRVAKGNVITIIEDHNINDESQKVSLFSLSIF